MFQRAISRRLQMWWSEQTILRQEVKSENLDTKREPPVRRKSEISHQWRRQIQRTKTSPVANSQGNVPFKPPFTPHFASELTAMYRRPDQFPNMQIWGPLLVKYNPGSKVVLLQISPNICILAEKNPWKPQEIVHMKGKFCQRVQRGMIS